MVGVERGVHDLLEVGGVERRRELAGDVDGAPDWESAQPRDLLRQRGALEVLEHHVREAIDEPHVDRLDDVRVTQPARGLGLGDEPGHLLGAGGVGVEHLDHQPAPDELGAR